MRQNLFIVVKWLLLYLIPYKTMILKVSIIFAKIQYIRYYVFAILNW
jgi:hypothetical protein